VSDGNHSPRERPRASTPARRNAQIVPKNAEIEPQRKSRFCASFVMSADSPRSRAYRNLARGKTGRSAGPKEFFIKAAGDLLNCDRKNRVFQHRVIGGSSSAQAVTVGRNLEEEIRHGYFAGLDISMDETHVLRSRSRRRCCLPRLSQPIHSFEIIETMFVRLGRPGCGVPSREPDRAGGPDAARS
jgi:hypothetical protein